MSKHTPGPWQLDPIKRMSGFAVMHSGEPNPVAIACTIRRSRYTPGISDAVATANARLIAAAPDLLEALESVQMALAGYTHQNDVTRAAMTKAWAALDKARQ